MIFADCDASLVLKLSISDFRFVVDNSGLKIISATDLSDAAKKVVGAIK